MSATATVIPFWTVPMRIGEVIEASNARMFSWRVLPESRRYSLENIEYGSGQKTLRATFEGGDFVEFLPRTNKGGK